MQQYCNECILNFSVFFIINLRVKARNLANAQEYIKIRVGICPRWSFSQISIVETWPNAIWSLNIIFSLSHLIFGSSIEHRFIWMKAGPNLRPNLQSYVNPFVIRYGMTIQLPVFKMTVGFNGVNTENKEIMSLKLRAFGRQIGSVL